MAITARDKHGNYTRARKAYGPKLDRGTARHYAIVDGVWSKGYVTRSEALAAEARMRIDAQTVKPQRAAMTVAEFGDGVWLPVKRSRGLKASSLADIEMVWAKHVRPAIGGIKLKSLKAADLRQFYGNLEKRGPSVARKAHQSVVDLLGLAVDDGYMAKNVARGRAVAPRKSAPTTNAWDADELRTFLQAVADDRLFACWRLAAMTGLRRGELLGLHWSAIDLENGRVTVAKTLVHTADGRQVWETPKTDQSRRVIDIDPGTVSSLRRHRVRQAEERLRSLGAWPTEGDNADVVFADPAGRPTLPAYLSRRFGVLVDKVEGLRRIRLHDLRHTHATILLHEGVPVHVVADRLGHKSPSITLNTYAHVLRGQASDAATRFAAAVDD
jgi:integrase